MHTYMKLNFTAHYVHVIKVFKITMKCFINFQFHFTYNTWTESTI